MDVRRCYPILLSALSLAGSAGVATRANLAVAAQRLPQHAAARASVPPHELDERPAWPSTLQDRLADLRAQLGTARAESEPIAPGPPGLRAMLDRASDDADVGVAVYDLRTGASIFEWQATRQFDPASNHKLLTATAALALLGPDYRFETELALEGDALYLVGGGDPSLQVPDLHALAQKVAAFDLAAVERILVDDSAFSRRRLGPGYDSDGPGYSYMAPSGALSLQFNTVEIKVRPGKAGTAVRVEVSPPCDHVRIVNAARTGRGRLTVTTRQSGQLTEVVVSGGLRPGAKAVRLRRRIADPSRFTATTFASALAANLGRELPVEIGMRPTTARSLAVHRSARLSEVLESALKYSNNFTTEQILRTLGHRLTGEPGDWNNGGRALREFWDAIGLPEQALAFENASGLGHGARVTPAALVRLLAVAAELEAGLTAAMPVAGREGTLAKRLRQTHGRVRAKTGTLAGVSGLTGIISEGGRAWLGFSILVNGELSAGSAKRIEDRLVLALMQLPPSAAGMHERATASVP